MTAKLRIRPATRADALAIAPLIRPEDLEEWIALAPMHQSPGILHSLIHGIDHGEAWYAEENGMPVAIGGLAEHDGIAAPWLMATPAVARHGREALRLGRSALRAWKERGLQPANVVSAKHVSAVRYIRACGYEIVRAFRVDGEPFLIFGACHV
ncbi:MAG: hypothetical protein LBI88_02580 [Deltaproteobacteria bacterium]|jgi:hypothetical protein|nr:hypothetical protein [Deltaproteobacteria bacterium]